MQINRYRLKDDFKAWEHVPFPLRTGGAHICKESVYYMSQELVADIYLYVCFPADNKDWNDFDYVEVLDENFAQPYTPFYNYLENGGEYFDFLKTVIMAYNAAMDSLEFLERIDDIKEGTDNNEQD